MLGKEACNVCMLGHCILSNIADDSTAVPNRLSRCGISIPFVGVGDVTVGEKGIAMVAIPFCIASCRWLLITSF